MTRSGGIKLFGNCLIIGIEAPSGLCTSKAADFIGQGFRFQPRTDRRAAIHCLRYNTAKSLAMIWPTVCLYGFDHLSRMFWWYLRMDAMP